jgi:hypothetical protein
MPDPDAPAAPLDIASAHNFFEPLFRREAEESGNAAVQQVITNLKLVLDYFALQYPIVHDRMDPNKLLATAHDGRRILPVHRGGTTHLVFEAEPGTPARAAKKAEHITLAPEWLADERWSEETLCGQDWLMVAVDKRLHIGELIEQNKICVKCQRALAKAAR